MVQNSSFFLEPGPVAPTNIDWQLYRFSTSALTISRIPLPVSTPSTQFTTNHYPLVTKTPPLIPTLFHCFLEWIEQKWSSRTPLRTGWLSLHPTPKTQRSFADSAPRSRAPCPARTAALRRAISRCGCCALDQKPLHTPLSTLLIDLWK